ncbi:MAG: class I SAM-dependent methyltransferase [Saprospiraceae bacterium]|nr:class I SAM-dependent methyltransferase [Saprospiraceae bacterium]
MIQTAERASSRDQVDNYVYQRCLFAYHEVKARISGNVLEIGTGSGLGIEILSKHCDKLLTIDKYSCELDFSTYNNVEFKQMEIPPLTGIADNTYDFVISFQVIEHIEDDHSYCKEIHRVLKPGGKFIATTPNKIQSLTRNPWHVREYTGDELQALLRKEGFISVEKLGTFGSKKVNQYIDKNKESVKKITRWDIFNLQYRLPRRLLQIPYDLMNRINRKNIAVENSELTSSITVDDFYVSNQNNDSLDLFFIATK